ncbi:hypothetical protein [Ligilactobacillus agilis]|uniref:hypothetical protein n=1 Tax=Ligilactobacillus agilis TaxID=1601 RepID=UPI001437D210|nr:hypothetical protein [Ligilactobacillus agilis]GET09905.1 hypothetical protein SN10121_03950 [Ligilactobacillus agilis]
MGKGLDDWESLTDYKQRKEYSFIKVDRNLIQSKEFTAEEKGLYLVLMTTSKQIATHEAYVNITLGELIGILLDTPTAPTIRSSKQTILDLLASLAEKKAILTTVDDERITAKVNTDYKPFTKFYNVFEILTLPKLRAKSLKKALRNIAIWGFVIASSGADSNDNAHIYINGLSYMASVMRLSYSTVKKNVDNLVSGEVLARKIYSTKDKHQHSLLALATDLDKRQLESYLIRKLEKEKPKQQQAKEQSESQADEESPLSFADEVSKILGFDVARNKALKNKVNQWKAEHGEDVTVIALGLVKPKLKEGGYKYENGKFNALYTINWVNKVLEDHVQRNGKTYWDMAKEIREHDKLVEQGKIKVIEDKDLPMTYIDLDKPDPNYQRQGSLTKDASKDIIDIDIDLEKLADETFGYGNPTSPQQAESEAESDEDEANMSFNDIMSEVMKKIDEKTKNNPLWQIEQTAQAHSKA